MSFTQKGQVSKRRIIDAALDLFKEKGYQHTTMLDICKSAGVATGTFYHYFKSKQDVLSAYVDQENQGVLEYYQGLAPASQSQAILDVVTYKAGIYEARGPAMVADLYTSVIISNRSMLNISDYAFLKVMEDAYRKGQQAGEFIQEVSPQGFQETAACIFFYTTLSWGFTPGFPSLTETLWNKFMEILKLHHSRRD